MSLHYKILASHVLVFGNTYPIREDIKARGGRYNGNEKNWLLPLTGDNMSWVESTCRRFGGGQIGEPSASIAAAAPAGAPVPSGDRETPGQSPEYPALTADGTPILSIRQLMDRLELAVKMQFPRTIWIAGEIQNISHKASGIFFDLAEPNPDGHANATTTVRAIIWKSQAEMIRRRRGESLKDLLTDGIRICGQATVQLHKDRGSITLIIDDIDPAYTRGALALAREKLLAELRRKGLDAANRQLPRPPFPLLIGLVSADPSRAYTDFVHQLESLRYPGKVLFVPTPMQGEQVPVAVARAIGELTAAGVDMIVITRGGGSAADLRWFDAPEIAYAIAACPLPVICAIGHHDDVCVAEEVCFMRQKTPTAAADFVMGVLLETRETLTRAGEIMARTLDRATDAWQGRIQALDTRLANATELTMTRTRERIGQLETSLVARSHHLLSICQAGLERTWAAMMLAASQALGSMRERVQNLRAQLDTADPRPWMQQGWTRLVSRQGVLKSIRTVSDGDRLTAVLNDGRLQLSVLAREPIATLERTKEAADDCQEK